MVESNDLPKKLVAAGALILNQNGDLLIVKPKYTGRAHYLPGGLVESNESPKEGCRREILEELSIDVSIGRLLLQDYERKSDSIQMIFDGGVLTQKQIAQIVIPTDELAYLRFVSRAKASILLSPKIQTRLPFAFRALEISQTVVLEDGVEI